MVVVVKQSTFFSKCLVEVATALLPERHDKKGPGGEHPCKVQTFLHKFMAFGCNYPSQTLQAVG